MKKIPHLVQYQGSKRNLATQILRFFPNKFGRLIEPFAGSAAMTIACASERKAERFLLNDLNKPLVDLLKLVIEEPEYTAKKYKEIWTEQHVDSIEHYYEIRNKFNLTQDPMCFLYLLARCVKGSVRYNSEGLFNQSPDKRRKGTNPSQMEKNIYDISSLLKGKVDFHSLDYKNIFNMALPGDIIYMDPPYQGVCGEKDSRYFSGIAHAEFVEELKQLIKKKISFVISYDGQCGNKIYGNEISIKAGIKHIELKAGRSSQATLLGKNEITYESLYISHDLINP
ncbi:MAG: DNA adenine methylase [Azoarcus sp.]|jgi:DNA adenine methylase|nr:DNA adenine methylase [Azoarcus sp.]